MTPDEAAQRVIFHSQPEEGSFLFMLRPYRGIREEVLGDLSQALQDCVPRLRSDTMDRGLVRALWAISLLGRSWALDPRGMLRRNDLISDSDLARLQEFLDRFDETVLMILLDEGSTR